MHDFLLSLAFNPYLFCLGLFLILRPFNKWRALVSIILFLPILGDYDVMLVALLVVQLIAYWLTRRYPLLLTDLFFYYLVVLLVPFVGETIGGLVQFSSIGLFHHFLSYLSLNLICLLPEVLFCWLVYLLQNKRNFKWRHSLVEAETNQGFFRFIVGFVWLISVISYSLWFLLENLTLKSWAMYSLTAVVFVLSCLAFVNLYVMFQQNQKYLQARIKTAQITALQHYTSHLEEANQALRRARHDYKNSLLGLNGYLIESNLSGAQTYLNKLVGNNARLQKASGTMTLELANLKVKELKYLLIAKLQRAQEQGIQTKVEVNQEIDHFPADIVTLVRCVGILLDNALEACSKQKRPHINVLLTKYANNSCVLVIQNTITHHLELKQIFKVGQTSKKNHQGLGLANVNQLVATDLHLSLEVDQEPKMISFELIMQ